MIPNDNILSFEELEVSHREKVTSYAKSIAKDELDYEDIYQRALIKAWKNFKKFKGSCKFSTWLCCICRNIAIDDFRKINRRKTSSYDFLLSNKLIKEPESNSNPFKDLINKETGTYINKAFNKLKPKHKEILIMHFNKDMSYRDISESLSIPAGTVMSRIFLAKKNIRKHLK